MTISRGFGAKLDSPEASLRRREFEHQARQDGERVP
jgi:hypothetical protein